MTRLVQITERGAGRYLLGFRRSDASIIEVAVSMGPGTAITAHPDLVTVGKWRDVNDIAARIVPAVQAFASAAEAEFDDK